MSKKKAQKEISEVSLKDPNQVIDLPRVGLLITADNLTVARYEKLLYYAPGYAKYFNVKTNPKKDEMESKE